MAESVPARSVEDLVGLILDEGPIGMSEAAKLLGKFDDGKPPHISTLIRFITSGRTNPAGELVHLEGIRVANRWATSRPAIVRFLAALQGQAAAPAAPVSRTATARRQSTAAAAAKLSAADI